MIFPPVWFDCQHAIVLQWISHHLICTVGMHPQMQELQHMALLSSHSRFSLSLCQSDLYFSFTVSLVCLSFFFISSLFLFSSLACIQLCRDCIRECYSEVTYILYNIAYCELQRLCFKSSFDRFCVNDATFLSRRIMGGKVQLFLLIC